MAAPRQSRPAAPRRRARTVVTVEEVGNPLENTPPVKPTRNAGFSPYPDLSMAISMLKNRLRHVSDDREPLIARWVETLERTQAEMQKLHKLEILTNRLTLPQGGK